MAVAQPVSTDYLNSPDHSALHRIIAADTSAPTESISVDSNGIVSETKQSRVRVGLSANQSVPNITATKIQLNSETYDNLGEFDSTTNYRFTATTAGYYQVNAMVALTITVDGSMLYAYIYKNGAAVAVGVSQMSKNSDLISSLVSDVVYLIAADYLELYAYHSCGAAANIFGEVPYTFMSVHKLS